MTAIHCGQSPCDNHGAIICVKCVHHKRSQLSEIHDSRVSLNKSSEIRHRSRPPRRRSLRQNSNPGRNARNLQGRGGRREQALLPHSASSAPSAFSLRASSRSNCPLRLSRVPCEYCPLVLDANVPDAHTESLAWSERTLCRIFDGPHVASWRAICDSETQADGPREPGSTVIGSQR